MTNYKLLKDIPGHKAGEIFTAADNNSLHDGTGLIAYTAEEISRHPDIMDWFEEVEKRWEPGKMENYYGIDEIGAVYRFTNHDQVITDGNSAIGNCFRTEEEAEKHLKWLKAVAVLRADTANQHPDWYSNKWDKWTAHYDYGARRLIVENYYTGQVAPFIFSNEDDVERSIAEHKAEWLTFLGVE